MDHSYSAANAKLQQGGLNTSESKTNDVTVDDVRYRVRHQCVRSEDVISQLQVAKLKRREKHVRRTAHALLPFNQLTPIQACAAAEALDTDAGSWRFGGKTQTLRGKLRRDEYLQRFERYINSSSDSGSRQDLRGNQKPAALTTSLCCCCSCCSCSVFCNVVRVCVVMLLVQERR